MYANTEWITHKRGDRLPKAHLDSEVMKRHFPSASIILTIHLLLFVLLFLNRISVRNYDREDKSRQTQWRRMDAESLRACGHVRAYDCIAAAYCIHNIKGFVISLCMDRHSLSWNGAAGCDVMKTISQEKRQTSFKPSGATSLLFYCKNSWRMSASGLLCDDIAVHTNYSFTGLLRESAENWSSGIVDYWH